jgi:hypothetical protein
MFGNDLYADCTVHVGLAESAESFRANRMLLARCSDVFAKLLFEQQTAESCVELHIQDCSSVAFRELLRSAHDLGPSISAQNFVDVFHLARAYEVEDLREAVSDWMLEALVDPAMALRALDAAQAKGIGPASDLECTSGDDISVLAPMLHDCLQTAALHCEDLLRTGDVIGCTVPTVSLLLQQDGLACDEEHLWMSLLQWAGQLADQSNIERLKSVTAFVRFNVMSSEFFVDHVVPSGALSQAEVVELLGARATGRPSRTFPDAHVHRRGNTVVRDASRGDESRREYLDEDEDGFLDESEDSGLDALDAADQLEQRIQACRLSASNSEGSAGGGGRASGGGSGRGGGYPASSEVARGPSERRRKLQTRASPNATPPLARKLKSGVRQSS